LKRGRDIVSDIACVSQVDPMIALRAE